MASDDRAAVQLPVAHGERLADGVTLTRLEPGGRNGPDDVVLSDVIGGLTWQDLWYLGRETDKYQMCIPDIRMPANQIWPLHWHDDWMFIVVLDGSVLVGDWVMERGDVLVTEPDVEYGPLVNGPRGCQLLEVFSKNRKGGGYAREYHDHPTLVWPGRVMYRPGIYKYGKAAVFNFGDRPPGSERNAGHSSARIDETAGLRKSRLGDGGRWDLGPKDDPERGAALDTFLRPGEIVPAHRLGDWRWSLILDGELTLGDRQLRADDILIVEPGQPVPAAQAGPAGVHMLELCLTVAGEHRRPVSG
jgi:hypothetical protein